MSEHTRKTGTVASAVVLAILVAVGLLVGSGEKQSIADVSEEESATTTTMPTAEDDARECPDTWKIVHIDHEDSNRWFADGVREIRTASTPEEAREAARTWLSLVRRDPNLLQGAASYFTDSEVNASDLVDGECASEEAESLVAEIELAIAEAEVTPEEAPVDGTNSGTDAEGNVTSASQAGITGDRAAIKVVLKDGTTIWIMARCGNPVVQGPAPVPPGPTDNPPAPPGTVPPGTMPPGTVPPGTVPPTTTLTPKDPTKDVNVNPAVPPQVRGPGTTPVGQDPGPATPSCDTPTGYCSGSEPTTTTTRPPSSGSGGSSSPTTVPSCGSAGQPSCSDTGSTPPTTTAPPAPPPPEQPPQDGMPESP